MSPYNVNVSGISSNTTTNQLNDFFTITQIDHEKDTAVIHFEKSSAAKTALMLNGGNLDGSMLTVTSDKTYEDEKETEHTAKEGHHIEQTDKPRAGIAAEYLARGYTLGDHVLKRAIQIDNEQGISKRFLHYFNQFDTKLGSRALGPDQKISTKVQSTLDEAYQKAKTVDEQKGYSKSAHEYYRQALASSFGQQVHAFYTSTSKQVQDIHEEARRIAAQHKASQAPASQAQAEPAAQEETSAKA
ncbi:hypothetical protein H0H92_008494 [Tricholoma furcatifolium]|nr:hypothetical protein H0H92_008494 [Tricholoma furcatifolium]